VVAPPRHQTMDFYPPGPLLREDGSGDRGIRSEALYPPAGTAASYFLRLLLNWDMVCLTDVQVSFQLWLNCFHHGLNQSRTPR